MRFEGAKLPRGLEYFVIIFHLIKVTECSTPCVDQRLIMKIGLDVLTLNRKGSLLKREAIWKLLSLVFGRRVQATGYRHVYRWLLK